MPGVRKGKRAGKYQGWFHRYDAAGKRRGRAYFTGTASYRETKSLAHQFDTRERRIALGLEAPATDSAPGILYADAVREYLEWGQVSGGRKGFPWNATVFKNREMQLWWWQETLSLVRMADLCDMADQIRAGRQQIKSEGRASSTAAQYFQALSSFCGWAVERSYITHNPVTSLGPWDTTPTVQRRVLSVADMLRVMQVAPEFRRAYYLTAFITGLRRGELFSLERRHVDLERSVIILEPHMTKSRTAAVQPAPYALLAWLDAYAASGEPLRLYERSSARRTAWAPPDDPLLFIPRATARYLRQDLQAAGVPHRTPAGKVDFHALRTAFINHLLNHGVHIADVRTLARHAKIDMTMVYTRDDTQRMTNAVNSLWESLGVSYVCHDGNAAVSSVMQEIENLRDTLSVTRASHRHRYTTTSNPSTPDQLLTTPRPLDEIPSLTTHQTRPHADHMRTNQGSPCVICVSCQDGIDADLVRVADRWPDLAPEMRSRIVAMVEAQEERAG